MVRLLSLHRGTQALECSRMRACRIRCSGLGVELVGRFELGVGEQIPGDGKRARRLARDRGHRDVPEEVRVNGEAKRVFRSPADQGVECFVTQASALDDSHRAFVSDAPGNSGR